MPPFLIEISVPAPFPLPKSNTQEEYSRCATSPLRRASQEAHARLGSTSSSHCGDRHPVDHRRPRLRRRHHRDDGRHAAQHRRIVLGGMPWIPKVNFIIPSSPRKTATNSCGAFISRRTAVLGPFILVIEGSIPDETNKAEGYWAAFGTDPATGQPITTCEWIDRLAPHAWAVVAAGTCATYGGIHAMEGNPTGCMGLPDYLGWQWKSKAESPSSACPGAPCSPTTSWRPCSTCSTGAGARR